LIFYNPGNEKLQPTWLSYSQLLADAIEKASLLLHLLDNKSSAIFLLHLDSQREHMVWFWAATLAGQIQAISTPFVNDTTQRRKHLNQTHCSTALSCSRAND